MSLKICSKNIILLFLWLSISGCSHYQLDRQLQFKMEPTQYELLKVLVANKKNDINNFLCENYSKLEECLINTVLDEVNRRNKEYTGTKKKLLKIVSVIKNNKQYYHVVFIFDERELWSQSWQRLEEYKIKDKWRLSNYKNKKYFIYVGSYFYEDDAIRRKNYFLNISL